MSRKLKKIVASTLAVAMMAGTVGNLPFYQSSVVQAAEAGATVSISKNLVANPGEEFTFTVDVTDNADGYSCLVAWLDIDTRYFEVVDWQPGDPTSSTYKRSPQKANTTNKEYIKPGSKNTVTLLQMYFDQSAQNFKGDNVYATVTLRVKDDVPAGNYTIGFDEEADGNAMQNRVGDDKVVAVPTPTYIDGMVKVAGGSTTTETTRTTTQTTKTTTQNPSTDGFAVAIKDAQCNAGETVKTSLDIIGNPGVAGFTVDLSYNTSALKFVSAKSADGKWDIEASEDGKKLVAVANPYADSKATGTAINLEFKAAATASGAYPISISSTEAATKSETVVAGTGQKGTITVKGGSTIPDADAMQFVFSDATIKAGQTGTVMLDLKNNTFGISSFQGDLLIGDGTEGFKTTFYAGDFDGTWTASKSNSGIQFLTSNGRNIKTGDGNIAEIDVVVPANTPNGTYEILFTSLSASSLGADGQAIVDSSKLTCVAGTITVTGGSDVTKVTTTKTTTGTTVKPDSDAMQFVFGDATIKAGQTGTVMLDVKNNTFGISSFQGDLLIGDGTEGFKTTFYAGDFDGTWTASKSNNGIQFLTSNGRNINTGNGNIAEIDVTVPANTPNGTYEILFTSLSASSLGDDGQKIVSASKLACVAGTITVTGGSDVTKVTTTKTTTGNTTTSNINKDAMRFVFQDVKVAEGATTATIKLNIENNTFGISSFQGDFTVGNGTEGFKSSFYASDFDGTWTASKSNNGMQFLSSNGRNIPTGDGEFAEIDIVIPAGTKAGVYDVVLTNLNASSLGDDGQKIVDPSKLVCVAGKLIIGDVAETTKESQTTTATSKVTTPSTGDITPENPSSGRPDIEGNQNGPTVSVDKLIKAKAGEEFTFQVKVTDNDKFGYSCLVAWLDIDTRYFELVDWKPGDPDSEGYKRSPQKANTTVKEYKKENAGDILTLLQMYFDQSATNLMGSNVFATVTLKVKEGVPDGYYPLNFDYLADGNAMCNYVVPHEGSDSEAFALNPLYVGGFIQVGDTTPTPTETKPSETTKPIETSKDTTGTTKPIDKDAMRFVFKDATVEAGKTNEISLVIENNTFGISSFQGNLVVGTGKEGFKTAFYAGDFDGTWTASKSNSGIQFLTSNGRNISLGDGEFASIDLTVPADIANGVYDIYFTDLQASTLGAEGQSVVDSSKLACVVGKLTVTGGKGEITTPTPTETKPSETTKPIETSKETTGTTKPIDKDAMRFVFKDATVEAGKTNEISLVIENNTFGISSFQGNLVVGTGKEGFKTAFYAGDFDGTWTASKSNSGIQFLTSNGRNISLGDGEFASIDLTVPADIANGVYDIYFTDLQASTLGAEGQSVVDPSKLACVVGKLTVTGGKGEITTPKVTETSSTTVTTKTDVSNTVVTTNGTNPENPSSGRPDIEGNQNGPTVSVDKLIKAKAGENVTFQIKVTDNDKFGYSCLVAWLDIDTKYFEFVDWKPGDPDSEGYKRSPQKANTTVKEYKKENAGDILTLLQMYFDQSATNLMGSNVYATVTLKVKENVPDGYYPLNFDYLADGNAMCNYVVPHEGRDSEAFALNPLYVGGFIQVGDPVEETTASQTTKPSETSATTKPSETSATTKPTETSVTTKPTETSVTSVTTSKPIDKDAMRFVFKDATVEAGKTSEISLVLENNTFGISSFQGNLVIGTGKEGFKTAFYASDFDGTWTASKSNSGIQFISSNGRNIATGDGEFAYIDLTVPADIEDGVYDIYFTDLQASTLGKDGQSVVDPSKLASVVGKITVIGGKPTTSTSLTTKPSETVTVTSPSETTKPTETSVTTTPTETSSITTPSDTVTSSSVTKTSETSSITTPSETTKPTETSSVTSPSETTKPTETSVTTKPSIVGDVDNNGIVNTRDLFKLKQYLLLAIGKDQVPNGDINKDGKITVSDLTHLIKLILG